jgi:hexosaminidase
MNSTKIRKWMSVHKLTTPADLLQDFETDLLTLVYDNLGKRPIVWQDVLDEGVHLPETTIIHVWKDSYTSVDKATSMGFDILLSSCWYLDIPTKDWWSFYTCNPRGYPGLYIDAQRAHILGGSACLWSEKVDANNFWATVWPRASAAAEILWSGSPAKFDSIVGPLVQGRLERFRCWLIQHYRIPVSPIGPGYCEHSDGI